MVYGEPLIRAVAGVGGSGAAVALRVIAAVDDGELGMLVGERCAGLAAGSRLPGWVGDIGQAEIVAAAVMREEIFEDGFTVFLEARHPEGDRGDIIGPGPDGVRVTAPYSFAKDFEKLTRDATLVGANVRFDERFLNDYLRKHHRVPSWFFRLCDVEALAQGYCGLVLPTGLAKCANIMEIPNEYVAHEALSDALLARDVYDAVVNDRFGRRKS